MIKKPDCFGLFGASVYLEHPKKANISYKTFFFIRSLSHQRANMLYKNGSPSLIDVILTNNSNLLFHNFNFNCGLSDIRHKTNKTNFI